MLVKAGVVIGNRCTAGRTHYSTSTEPPGPRTLCSPSAGDCLQSPCSAAHNRQPTKPLTMIASCIKHKHGLYIAPPYRRWKVPAGPSRLPLCRIHPWRDRWCCTYSTVLRTTPQTCDSDFSTQFHLSPGQVCCVYVLAGAGTLEDWCHC